jgi:two-component system CheB/CheR fusion protein
MKSNLISFVSHELKTPIVPILGWSQLMQKALDQGLDLNKVIEKEGVEGIIRSSNRLSTIINNFLDLDRLERGSIHLEKQPWPVITLLDNAIKEVKDSAQVKMISIKNSCENLTLDVDAFRIERVFINILTNAIKYSETNTSVEIYSEKEETKFHIYFQDQGYGFTAEELRDIWQPFTTAYLRKKNTSSTGTGIGLRLSKGIIEEHSGHIEISSPGPDKGSTIKITFPLKGGQ